MVIIGMFPRFTKKYATRSFQSGLFPSWSVAPNPESFDFFLGFLSLLWPFLSAACKTQKARKALHRNTALKICVETCLRIYIHCIVRGCEWAQRKLNRIVVCISCSFKHKLHYYSYIQQRIFSIKRKRRQKSWFIFPLHRNCNISLWLFPPLSEEISEIKIAISETS